MEGYNPISECLDVGVVVAGTGRHGEPVYQRRIANDGSISWTYLARTTTLIPVVAAAMPTAAMIHVPASLLENMQVPKVMYW